MSQEHAVLVDASVAVYALGDPGPRRDACRLYLENLWAGKGRAYASVEMIQEVVFHRRRRRGGDNRAAVADVRDLMPSFVLLNFDREVVDTALELMEATTIRGRDAVQAATALAYGIPTIASTDGGFDGVPGVRRVDPTAD